MLGLTQPPLPFPSQEQTLSERLRWLHPTVEDPLLEPVAPVLGLGALALLAAEQDAKPNLEVGSLFLLRFDERAVHFRDHDLPHPGIARRLLATAKDRFLPVIFLFHHLSASLLHPGVECAVVKGRSQPVVQDSRRLAIGHPRSQRRRLLANPPRATV